MSSAFTAGIHREFRNIDGIYSSMTKETVWVVFGDVYNSDSRIILCPDEDETADISLWGDPAYATVNIGPEIVTGPVLYDKNVHIGWGTPHMERTIMVHAGSQLPLWLDGPLPGVFGWRPLDAEDMPIHARVFEADVLLLVPKEHGVTGWIRTIHLPRVGRPMERMTIPLGLGTSATAPGARRGNGHRRAAKGSRARTRRAHRRLHRSRNPPGVRMAASAGDRRR